MSGSHIAVTGVLNTDPTKPKEVHTRYEISDLQANHKEQFELLLRSWANLMTRDEHNSLSFYGIGSIHGVPYVPWPFETKPTADGRQFGYCFHRSVLFPTWHRPYCLLLEQELQKEAVKLANEFSGRPREIYAEAARKLRLPYWDWATKNSFLPRSVLYDTVQVAVPGPNGTIQHTRIDNPLLKYKFKDRNFHKKYFVDAQAADKTIQKWSDHFETMRCPDDNGVTQHDVVDDQLSQNQHVLRDAVYKLMSVNEYNSFSNTYYNEGGNANNYQSLEGIHDSIHVICGIDPTPLDGHMGDPMYAGFDPLFCHCNVDRLLSIWQVLHPEVGVSSQVSVDNTMVDNLGTTQNAKSPLYPFRKQSGEWHTSESFERWDSCFQFGYTFPEMPPNLLNRENQTLLKENVTKSVNQLYAPKNPNYPPVPRERIAEANEIINQCPKITAAPSRKPHSILGAAIGVGLGVAETTIDTAATILGLGTNERGYQLVPGISRPFDFNAQHHREWIANIRIEHFAISGPFFIHIFLGDFNPERSTWLQEVNLVGTHAIFSSNSNITGCDNCKSQKEANVLVSGSITLTDALIKRNATPDLEPDTVAPYLKDNLHWRVQGADGTVLENTAIPSLKILVTCTIVETTNDNKQLPYWGPPQVIESVTSGRPGGYGPDDTI